MVLDKNDRIKILFLSTGYLTGNEGQPHGIINSGRFFFMMGPHSSCCAPQYVEYSWIQVPQVILMNKRNDTELLILLKNMAITICSTICVPYTLQSWIKLVIHWLSLYCLGLNCASTVVCIHYCSVESVEVHGFGCSPDLILRSCPLED